MPALCDLKSYCEFGLGLFALLYFLGACWFITGTRRSKATSDLEPMVSIVVAARDEAQRIAGCLRALLDQDYPQTHYEIIVVDDGSKDGTDRIVDDFVGGPVALRLMRTDGQGSKKAALSLGIAEARGELILTTDADCLVAGGWVSGMVAHFTPEVGFVIGYSQIGAPGEICNWRQGYEAVDFTSLMTCIWGSAGWGRPMAASGQNLAFRRAVFNEVGGYEKVMHRASGDDVLLLQMVRNLQKWSIVFATAETTFARHPVAESWGGLLGQRSRWASNATIIARLDPLFFGYMIITYILSVLTLVVPVMWWVDWLDFQWLAASLGLKVLAEVGAFSRGLVLSGRRELSRYLPFWVLLQPLHVVIVGGLGVLGLFHWKGRSHRWGRRVPQQGGSSNIPESL